MKNKIFLITCFLSLMASCSSSRPLSSSSQVGEVVDKIDDQTFHAKFKGRDLKVGDRVRIFRYEEFEAHLQDRQSRNLPQQKKKIITGKGVISSVLDDDYYEFKSEKPKNIAEGTFIEKF